MSAGAERPLPIAAPATGAEEWEALRGPLESGRLTQGPELAAFEEEFARRHGVERAVATSSGTTALHLALLALGVGPGDEVVVPAFTWVATANSVVYCGATPVLADVDPGTYNLAPTAVAERLSPRTRAVMPVHQFGLCADVEAISSLLPEGVVLLEDAACAAGAAVDGRPAGSLGHAGTFSFHPRKVLTTGEGGMVTSSDAGLAEVVARLRNHGQSPPAQDGPWAMAAIDELGWNFRMTELQAAVGRVQLAKLDRLIDARDRIAAAYAELLGGIEWLRLPRIPSGYRHSWQSYVAVVEEGAPAGRNELIERLDRRGVQARPGTHCVSELELYRRLAPDASRGCPTAVALERSTIALPMHSGMEPGDAERVAAALLDA